MSGDSPRSFAHIDSDVLVTFAYRRWEELIADAGSIGRTFPYQVEEQRQWEMVSHLFAALDAKVEKVRWFAQRHEERAAGQFGWLAKWRSAGPLLTRDGQGRLDKQLGHRPRWSRLRLCLLDVQDLRHGLAHPTPTEFTEVATHPSVVAGIDVNVVEAVITESRSTRVDTDHLVYPHTGLPWSVLEFDREAVALCAAILVAAILETNLEFDQKLFTHTNGRAWGRSVEPEIWLRELLAVAGGKPHVISFLEEFVEPSAE